MNGFNEYDVEDDLPVIIPTETNRFDKKQKKVLEEDPSKPARKPRPKLDYNRLLRGNRGLGYLAITAKKNLKLSGRPGSEADDLSQINVYLQEWAKLVFPKMALLDFLGKVEEVCQSRIMKACVPEILSKLKEMGDGVNLNDLETVESEIMTKLATSEAEKALESINAGLDKHTTSISHPKDLDFDLSEMLANHSRGRKERSEKSEIIGTSDSEEMEDDHHEDDEEYSRDMNGFINDNSAEDDEEEEVEEEKENKIKEEETLLERQTGAKSRGISFNFESSEDENEEEAKNQNLISTTVEDKDNHQKKRPSRLIFSDEE